LSLGYCNTFVKEIHIAAADTRTELDSSLPEKFKFLGVTFFGSWFSPQGPTGTINEFKIFDGPTSSDPVLVFYLVAGQANTYSANQGSYTMLDDTYIEFNEGIYLEVTNANFSAENYPFVLTLMYI
jgi:hypothetical protein